ncbi:MAG TPA: hypothetical protein VE243_10850 [Candidatus Acidoferrum sp.]|nr:hypothetical protein [Candidatus Acidoferrum sp.]
MRFAGELDFQRRLFDVKQNIQQFTGKRASAALAVTAILCGAFAMMPVSRAWAAATAPAQSQHPGLRLAAEPTVPTTPDAAADDDDKDVPTSQVDKYINVYGAMQKDHSLTVEQAASKQGLTVAQFRSLENKIEADDTLRERVRKALRHAANPNDKESAD